MVACAGLINDHHCNFLCSFHCNIRYCSSVWAKLWSLYLGIKLARTMNLNLVVFELDSKVVLRQKFNQITAFR